MVKPSLPTLFGRPQELPIRGHEETFGNVTPFNFYDPADDFPQHRVLLLGPFF